ncbi:MAG TPA: AI-2E family transporter, partial [Burkholderiaceae bacterium]|nr:AI-2E family transporter [Burkholderiaceae bacterium]
GQAILLTLWGAIVVGLADNVLYPMVVGRYLRLHTVLLLIAMIGGLFLFGPAGFFVGPVLLALTATMLAIWRERASAAAPAEAEPAARE